MASVTLRRLQTASLAFSLVQGLVIDRDGQGVDKADVRFYGPYAREIAHAHTDRAGKFSVKLTENPQTWSASAKGYEQQTLRFADANSLTLVLYPREAPPAKLESADLAVLPYQDAGYAFSLVPFAVIQGGSTIGVGDRGLSGSATSFQGGGSSFDEIPAQYLAFAGISRAFHSYRYGNGAAGHYTLGFDKSGAASAQSGSGSLQMQSAHAGIGAVFFGYGTSTGDLTRRSRFDVVSRSDLGAGKLLFTAGQGNLRDWFDSPQELQTEDEVRLRLDEPWLGDTATLEVKSGHKYKNKIADSDEGGGEFTGEFRLRSLGAMFSNETGIKVTRDTAVRALSSGKMFSGTGITNQIFESETYTGSRLFADASLAWYGLHDAGVTHKQPAGVVQQAGGLAAAIQTQWQFSDRFALAGTVGSIVDTPSPGDQFFGDPIPGLLLNRSALVEGSLLYDSPGGFSAELTSYSEKYTTASPTTNLSGAGIAFDWPISPNWRLRAWTLSLRDFANGLLTADLGPSYGRDVAWLTYYGGRAVRLDAVYRRETDPVEAGRYLDADAAINVAPHLTLIGTMERHHFTSSYGLSLRLDVPKP